MRPPVMNTIDDTIVEFFHKETSDRQLRHVWASSIEKFDCIVVDLGPGAFAGYCTVIPISPKEHRKDHPTKAKVEIQTYELYTEFHIWSDWGDQYIMRIPARMKKEIKAATDAAIEYELFTPPSPY